MYRRWVLPMFIVIFALFSVMTLKSIAPELLSKQVLYFLAGGVIFLLTSRISFQRWITLSPFLYGILLILLLITQIIGRVTRGATSWIPVGSFHIQPSQLAIAWGGLFFAMILSRYPLKTWKRFLAFSALALIPAFFIFIQPELGTTIVYLISLASIFLLINTKPKFILFSAVAIILVAILAWNFLLKPYQKDRINSFLNSQENSTSASYNAQQAVIAVGSGELFGRGIGQGVQSHLRFLPERQTDFVFASFAEEMGLVGALPIILLYASLTFFLLYAAYHAKNQTEQYYCTMTATMIAVQSVINIGMNMSLLPITGITLPFFSYGGSSILSLCFQIGCIQSILHSYRKSETLYIR